jgi:hypothetical protein
MRWYRKVLQYWLFAFAPDAESIYKIAYIVLAGSAAYPMADLRESN